MLDEPSIGLHQRDNRRLIETLTRLRDLGNTLIVVEHDEDTIRTSDWVVDIGPYAGEHGGKVVHSGPYEELLTCEESLTGAYLSGRSFIEVPAIRRPVDRKRQVTVVGAREHNLDGIDVSFPLGVLTAVTGVSGSGKSTLVNDILATVMANKLNGARQVPGRHTRINGLDQLDKLVQVDQSPIGRTPRSNAGDVHRGLRQDPHAVRGRPRRRKSAATSRADSRSTSRAAAARRARATERCKIEMNFLPDVYVPCEVCHGARYNRETLEVHYKGKSIAEVLDMPYRGSAGVLRPGDRRFTGTSRRWSTSDWAMSAWASRHRLSPAVRRSASSSPPSCRSGRTGRTVYILDEPTTGLHFEDIRKLLLVINGLVDKGNSVIVIEHNLDVIKTADWVVDMGPEGGSGGGTVVAQGTPEDVAAVPESYTGKFLSEVLTAQHAPVKAKPITKKRATKAVAAKKAAPRKKAASVS